MNKDMVLMGVLIAYYGGSVLNGFCATSVKRALAIYVVMTLVMLGLSWLLR